MEAFIGLILVIAIITFIFFFKGMIKKSGSYAEDVVTVNIAESQIDLIKRSMDALNEIEAQFGEDFMTPQQVYDKIQHRKKKVTDAENAPKKTKKWLLNHRSY